MWVSLPELEDMLGKDMAKTLTICVGGVEMYVPVQADAAHLLGRTVGLRGMQALCAAYGGRRITVPNGKREPYKHKIMQLLEQGKTRQAIAQECGVTERYVYHVASYTQLHTAQLTLF